MITRFIVVLFVMLGVVPNANAQRGNPSMTFAGQSIDAMIADFMTENGIPGMALAIVQAPYIPRVTGYGLADTEKRLLVGSNTLFDVGQMANAYTAVAIMQLVEMGKLRLDDAIGAHLRDLPDAWKLVTVRQLLSHASGIPDYHQEPSYDPARTYEPAALTTLIGAKPLAFQPGSRIGYSATDYVLLARLVEAVSGQHLRDFVRERQFEALDLQHTVFADEIERIRSEAVELNNNRHKHFLAQSVFINPTERAGGYVGNGEKLATAEPAHPLGEFGYGSILASAMDISIWDIGLAGGILVKDPALRAILYNPATLADGTTAPVMGEWRFPGRKGLMYVTGSDNGHSAFLSRFTDASELVCVTLMANKEGVDLTQLGRKIAGAYDPRLAPPSTGVRTQQSPYPMPQTLERFVGVLRSDGLATSPAADGGVAVTAAPGLTLRASAWEQDGQVWVGYIDAPTLTRDLRVRLDRDLLRAVTPY